MPHCFAPGYILWGQPVTAPIRPCQCSVSLLHCRYRKCIITSFPFLLHPLTCLHSSSPRDILGTERKLVPFRGAQRHLNLIQSPIISSSSTIFPLHPYSPVITPFFLHRFPHISRRLVLLKLGICAHSMVQKALQAMLIGRPGQ